MSNNFIRLSNTNIVLVDTSIDGSNVILAVNYSGANLSNANGSTFASYNTYNTISLTTDYTSQVLQVTSLLETIANAAPPIDYSGYFTNFSGWGSSFASLSYLSYLQTISASLSTIATKITDIRDDIRVLKERGDNERQGIVTRGVDWDSSGGSNRALIRMALDSDPSLRDAYNKALKEE